PLPYVVLAIASLILNFAFVRSTPLSTLPTDLFDPRDPTTLRTSFSPEQVTGLVTFGVVVGIIGLLVLSVQAAALVDAMAKRYLGQPATLAGSLRAGLRASVRLILATILQTILGVLFAFVFLGTIASEGPIKTVLQEVANLAVNALWAPIQWGVFTLLYYDLRVRKEAFDLQLAAESIPRAT